MSTAGMTSREVILSRVRAALRDVTADTAAEDSPLPRSYRSVDPAPRADLVARFIARVAEYKATVRQVTTAELSAAIADACRKRGVKSLVVPGDLPAGWAPTGVTLLRDPGLTFAQLDQADGVLTACALGIAQTGTIVLDGGSGQGRRALSLLPDYHLCVIRDDQIVGLVPEAIQRLHSVASAPERPVTLISGPSATSDIELSRVEGVHGPRTLEVLVVATAEE
jgi:L-lactate dehydrogenase complex protein LldG